MAHLIERANNSVEGTSVAGSLLFCPYPPASLSGFGL